MISIHVLGGKYCELDIFRKDLVMTLVDERKELEEQRRELERERKAFLRHVENQNRHFEQQKNLFETKFHILEEEMMKLAEERAEIEKKKAFYDMVDEFHAKAQRQLPDYQLGEVLFRGVESQQSLKKRYKALVKIYHPDNIGGDDSLVTEINKEYDHLSQMFA